MATTRAWPDPAVAADLRALRERAPLTHCLTNVVVTNVTANVLLAAGAAPAMVPAVEEAGPFAQAADALLVNVGTVTAADAAAMRAAVAAAGEAGTPWVLDPVAVGALPLRTGLARELAARRPAVVRGNGSEILALAGAAGGGRGVDSTVGSEAALDAARGLAAETGAVVAVSGAVDRITDGERVVEVPGGHVLLTRVTGAGCALGALMAAFLAVSATPLDAAVAASAVMKAAGERAAAGARGPGSFAVALLDELALLGRP
ncbi:MAG: hydroxyethylthiazole kinase [Solirubrobacteraceae bacterium]|nr:hydroxyethylthiazole kinase [Solirubrobacteraceae bacterium]